MSPARLCMLHLLPLLGQQPSCSQETVRERETHPQVSDANNEGLYFLPRLFRLFICACRIPQGTSHFLGDLLIKLLKKHPKERLSYGESQLGKAILMVCVSKLLWCFLADFFQHDFLKDPSSFSLGECAPPPSTTPPINRCVMYRPIVALSAISGCQILSCAYQAANQPRPLLTSSVHFTSNAIF